MNFFITGLPRSRTAWLANFLSYDGNFCYHEMSRFTSDVRHISDLFRNSRYASIGNSDCVLPYYFDRLIDYLPNFNLVIIERNFDEVISNLDAISLKNDAVVQGLKVSNQKLEKMKDKYEHLLVPFEELDDMEKCREIWHYCTGPQNMDEERWKELDVMNLEVNWDKYKKYLNAEELNKIMTED